MSIHDNLKKLREEHNLTLEEVGKRVGTTKQTIKRYESGEISAIPYDRIVLLAKCYNVTPSSIMGWEDNNIIIESAETDVKLSNMDNRMKEYALKMNKLSHSEQELIMQMIDKLSEK
jgi:transcriptional regulator with XRE-family HTH domain